MQKVKVRAALWLLGLSAAARLLVAFATEPTFDEAYYWTWSRSLEWSYFDHPPMIAWLIRALGIRGASLLCGAAAVALMYGFGRDLWNSSEAGERAAALWSVLPASVFAGVFATPDAPLMPFWLATLWALHRKQWVLAGALAGGAMLSKYTGVLLAVPAVIAWAQARGRWRSLLGGVAAAAVVFSPVVVWNAAHGWSSFRFQLGHGLVGSEPSGADPLRLLVFAGGQLAMAGLVFVWACAWTVRGQGAPAWLRASFAAPIALFAAASVFAPSEANWAQAAYLGACPWLGASWNRSARWSAGLAALVCAVGASHFVWPVARPTRDSLNERAHGWAALSEVAASRPAVAYASNFGLAAQVAYAARVPVAVVGHSRLTQFDFWPVPAVAEGSDAVFVSEGELPPPPALAQSFQSVEGPRLIQTGYRGRLLHTFRVWALRSARGQPDQQRPSIASPSPRG